MRRGESSKKIYVDVNVLYYYLTAHPEFGERAKRYLEEFSGRLVTSALTAWLLHVLTRLEGIASILEEVGVELIPLDAWVLREAERLSKPREFEDRIHLATMRRLDLSRIVSNDEDFDGIPGVERFF